MLLPPTTPEEVMDKINNLENSNSTGVDNISVRLAYQSMRPNTITGHWDFSRFSQNC